MTGKTQMPRLQRFERVVLAWALITIIAAGPLSADRLKKKTTGVGFVDIPEGTQTVTLTWSVTAAVLPDREWNCGNGQGGFIDMFSYTPDEWTVKVLDAGSGATVAEEGGTTPPLLFSCPGTDAPQSTPLTFSSQIDVSAYTANGDATFLLGTDDSGEFRTSTPGPSSPPFNCDPLGQPFTIGAIILVPPQSFTFDMTMPQKLLTYLAPADKDAEGNPNYPSTFQRRAGSTFTGVDLGDKPQMFISGSAFGVTPGKKVWLKLLDPPDPSPYVPANPPHINDNKDVNAKLFGPDGKQAKTGKALPVVVDSDGKVQVILEGAKDDAGDNYQVMASTSRPDDNDVFPCEAPKTCSQSPVITVWKRQYFEQAQMVMQGAFLAEDIVGSTDPCSTVNPCVIRLRSADVDGNRVIQPGTQLTLMSMGTIAASVPDAPFHEDVTVDANSSSEHRSVRQEADGTWAVRLTSRPRLNYYGNLTTARAALDAVAVHDASGAIAAFSVNTAAVKTLLNDAFIEYADADPVSWPYIPYVGVASIQDESYLGKRWFQHAIRGGEPIAEPYHRLIVAAKRATVEQNCNTLLGSTLRAHDEQVWRLSYIYEYTLLNGAAGPLRNFYRLSPDQGDDSLPQRCAGKTIDGLYRRDASIVEQLDVAHEVVHQYRVNHSTRSADGRGHCGEMEYTGHFICLMNKTWPGMAVDDQIKPDEVRLHYLPPGVDSEYTEIRKLKELLK